MQDESITLNNIHKVQVRSINQYTSKYENKTEMKKIKEKLQKIKDEHKTTKDQRRSDDNRLKEQRKLTLQLEDKCKKMKDRIEFIKNRNKPTTEITEEMIQDLADNINQAEIEISEEENQYKVELMIQQEDITKLNEHILLLTNQIKEREQVYLFILPL